MINPVSTFKNIGISGTIAKTAGVASLALVGYDAHHFAKESAHEFEKEEKAGSLTSNFLSDMKCDSPSAIKNGLKKQVFLFNLDENLTDFFANIKGYCSGIGKIAVQNTIPIALSAGALLSKGVLSKTCGIGLAAYGGIFLLQEIFGIGKAKE